MVEYYTLSVDEVFEELKTSREGLDSEQASERLEEYGRNELREEKGETLLDMFLRQFQDFLVLILIVAGGVAFLFGEMKDAVVIGVIVVLNALFGFFQEYRAEKALDALKEMTSPDAKVIREGDEKEIEATNLVPGDILILETGDRVPADARVIESTNLQVDEAPLTGESFPVTKNPDELPRGKGVTDRINTVFMGTTVTRGRGKAVVTRTGMESEFGKIAGMVQVAGTELTPLQKRLKRFGKSVGIIILIISALIAGVGIFKGEPVLEMLLTGISLAVAAIPEGLPAVVTITLALGMQKMAKQNAIVRKLSAVETLGSTSVICSDKTGTLTRNELSVRKIYVGGEVYDVEGVGYDPEGKFLHESDEVNPLDIPGLKKILEIGVLNNNAKHVKEEGNYVVKGDTTEGALLVAAKRAGMDLDKLPDESDREAEVPFDADRRLMSTVYPENGKLAVYVKGAPEAVLENSSKILENGSVKKLTESKKKKLKEVYSDMAEEALRVLAFAYRELPASTEECKESNCERDLVFAGFQGMIDLPRNEAEYSIRLCEKAGIRVIMITGDHGLTAKAIGVKLGLVEEDGRVIEGEEVNTLSDEELKEAVAEVSIFARVSPEQKLRIVRSLKSRGHVVAVTGDGVNDAPSLKESQIGVAMGITGTDVSKEASDMILTDDNFATIVNAVAEGRRIFDNIRKFVRYLLAANFSEVLIILGGTLMDLPLPLKPIQILWINLVTDGLPALALGVEPSAPGIMERNPRDPDERILSKKLIYSIAFVGVAGAVITLSSFILELDQVGVVKAQTMAFTTLMVFEMFVVFMCRSETHPLHKIGFLSNPWLLLAVASSLLLQFLVLNIPFLRSVFSVVPISFDDWVFIFLISSVAFIIEEVYKILTHQQ